MAKNTKENKRNHSERFMKAAKNAKSNARATTDRATIVESNRETTTAITSVSTTHSKCKGTTL